MRLSKATSAINALPAFGSKWLCLLRSVQPPLPQSGPRPHRAFQPRHLLISESAPGQMSPAESWLALLGATAFRGTGGTHDHRGLWRVQPHHGFGTLHFQKRPNALLIRNFRDAPGPGLNVGILEPKKYSHRLDVETVSVLCTRFLLGSF